MSRGPVGETSKVNPESAQDGPYELPEGWVWTPLGEAIEFNYGKGLPARRRNVSGGVSVYGSNGVVGCHDKALTSSPVLIVGRKGSVGEVHLSSAPCWPIDTTYFVDRFPSGLDPTFLFRYLRSQRLRDLDRSTAVPGINREDLYRLSIPLPPLNEQQRIVAKIEALFGQSRTARQALDRIPPLLKKFRQSVLAAAFRGDLTRDWREQNPDVEPASELLDRIRAERRLKWEEDLRARGKDPRKTKYEEPNPVDIGELPKLPEQWVWTNVGRLATPEPYALVDGPFGSNLKTADYAEKGVRVIRLQNIGESEFKDRDYAFISRAKFETLQKHRICPGDLIFATLGDPVARVCRFPVDHPVALVKADCIRFKVDAACAKSLYVMWALNTVDAHKRAEAAAHGIGRLRVNLNEIKQLPVPLAPPLEQRQIVAIIKDFFHQADAIEAAVEVARRRAEKLEQSILARAFRGELVPQDPDDEPASAILDRISAERMRSSIGKGPAVSRRKGEGRQNGD